MESLRVGPKGTRKVSCLLVVVVSNILGANEYPVDSAQLLTSRSLQIEEYEFCLH